MRAADGGRALASGASARPGADARPGRTHRDGCRLSPRKPKVVPDSAHRGMWRVRWPEPLVVGETCTGAATLQAYRMFNESFRFGGRFYGQSTQNIPKELRATITINDSATDEPDFPSLHPQLLYALVGRHLPHDPYDLDGWDRPTVKTAFNTMLNAKTPGSAMLAVAKTMGGYSARHREKAKRLIAEIERKHAPVAEHFGSGIGLRLQRTDSDIAARVLAKSGKEGEFLLSLHDGFRSRRQYADRTREIMDECYEKVVGKSPAIPTLKRKRDLQIWSPVVVVLGWMPGPLPLPMCVVVSLPPSLASLVVVSAFYSGSVVGVEQAA